MYAAVAVDHTGFGILRHAGRSEDMRHIDYDTIFNYGGFGLDGQQVDLPANRNIEAPEALFAISGADISILVDAGTVPPSAALNFGLSISL